MDHPTNWLIKELSQAMQQASYIVTLVGGDKKLICSKRQILLGNKNKMVVLIKNNKNKNKKWNRFIQENKKTVKPVT